eukprot:6491462-Amphidinium_carterae.1
MSDRLELESEDGGVACCYDTAWGLESDDEGLAFIQPTLKRKVEVVDVPFDLPSRRHINDLCKGPTSAEEALATAEWVLEVLSSHMAEDGDGWHRFRSGLVMCSDYSGVGPLEEVLRQLVGHCDTGKGGTTNVSISHASDISDHCREILALHPAPFCAGCVFGNVNARTPMALMRSWQGLSCNAMSAHKQSPKASKLEAGHKVLKQAAALSMLHLKRHEQTAASDLRAYCYRHKQECVVPCPVKDEKVMTFNLSGVSCVDWSTMGLQKGWLGSSLFPFLQFVYERHVLKEDLIVIENVVNFDKESYRSWDSSNKAEDIHVLATQRQSEFLGGRACGRCSEFLQQHVWQECANERG